MIFALIRSTVPAWTAADPQAWKIVDGKLYLSSSIKAKEMAESDPSVLSRAQTGFQGKKK